MNMSGMKGNNNTTLKKVVECVKFSSSLFCVMLLTDYISYEVDIFVMSQ